MPIRLRRGLLPVALAFLAALPPVPRGGAAPAAPAAETPAPVVPILERYRLLAAYQVRPVAGKRADYSGLAVRSRSGRSVRLWLVDDKPARLEFALAELRLALPAQPEPGLRAATPTWLPVDNPARLPAGGDIEDIGWLDGNGRRPGVAAVVGEIGPGGVGRSWLHLLVESGPGLRLVYAADASPEGESVGNDGLEGVAVRGDPADPAGIEVFAFKERPAPTYGRGWTFTWSGDVPAPVGRPLLFSITGMSMQSGAVFDSAAGTIRVIERRHRRIAVVGAGPGPGLEADGQGALSPREWLDFTAVDSLLEGRTGDLPPALFGTVEGIALDREGCLYLLSDNNETRHSRLLVLEPRKGPRPARPAGQ